jgi:hypothetical protein
MINNLVANAFRVYDDKLLYDPDFMAGWRCWSFYKTRNDELSTMNVTSDDVDLITQMKQKGHQINNGARADWNAFRSKMLLIDPSIKKTMHYHDQYRVIFKRVAFVVVDCCFAIKYKMDSDALRKLLAKMFKATNVSVEEEPVQFIILENDITDSEFNHKLNQLKRNEYRGTQDKILAYRAYNPNLYKDRLAKTRVPFGVTHNAMIISEQKVRKKISEARSRNEKTELYSRAGINDRSLLYMIDKIRRSFGLCARVALLSDDFGMLHYASTFYAPPNTTSSYPNLPRAYLEHYITTPFLLDPCEWNMWRRTHVHPYFANHIADI